ncbi:MAG: DUF4271 domain-containing protein [Mangrovibacterium sp.]
MLQDLRNDTLLRQLHQAVEIPLSESLFLPGSLTRPVADESLIPLVVPDSLGGEDVFLVPQQLSPANLSGREPALVPLSPVQPGSVGQITEDSGNSRLFLPERKLDRNTSDWEMGVFIIVLILLGSVRLFYKHYLSQLFSSTVNAMTASRMFRERSLSLVRASFRLDVIFYLVFSLFVFYSLQTFKLLVHPTAWMAYLQILAGIFIYFLLKRLAYYLLGQFSRTVSETFEFLYNMGNFNRASGILLLPLTLVIAFTPLHHPVWVIAAGGIVILLLYISLIFRGVKILIRKHFSIFYLILYLCTLEILPLLVICKLVFG